MEDDISYNSLRSGYFHDTLRAWQSGQSLKAEDLIYPVFISPDDDAKEEIHSLPQQFRLGINKVVDFLKPVVDNGLKTVLLFGIMESQFKDGTASNAVSPVLNKVIPAIELLKKAFPTLMIACDVCLCTFTDHGHCGILKSTGCIDNDASIKRLAEIALAYRLRGCHIVAPSDMMDGRIAAISAIMKSSKLRSDVSIMSYSAKFASCLYGPFRDAAGSAPSFGDRRCYQLPPGAKGQAMRAAKRDIEEGADIVMVKPGMPYLDIVQQIKSKFPEYPVAVYQVSGEYSMLYNAYKAGAFELKKGVKESLDCMKRAGADIIITYFTPLILEMLRNPEAQ